MHNQKRIIYEPFTISNQETDWPYSTAPVSEPSGKNVRAIMVIHSTWGTLNRLLVWIMQRNIGK